MGINTILIEIMDTGYGFDPETDNDSEDEKLQISMQVCNYIIRKLGPNKPNINSIWEGAATGTQIIFDIYTNMQEVLEVIN